VVAVSLKKIYRLELAFIGRLFAQSADLYAQIEMTNPHGDETRRSFLDAATKLDAAITGGRVDEFRTLFDDVARYFKDFAGEAMQLSDFIIDAMVRRP
jgi:chorismate mutase/prephenate dehydrogenase